MANTRGRDTTSELALRRAVHALGLRYRVDVRPVPSIRRRADLVFTRATVAVFLDGCFWHGCPEHISWPRRNAAYWRSKIEANQRRDLETDRLLRAGGWTVVRVWEHEVPSEAAHQIARVVRGRLLTDPDAS
jgi:DNA mismatch endonuclease (patch repair protein)